MDLLLSTLSFFEAPQFGVISARGPDAGKFLHRMSTNNIDELAIGETLLTAFLNAKGRLVAVAQVSRAAEQEFQLLVPYENADVLLSWLDQYLFVEDLSLEDQSAHFALFWRSEAPLWHLVPKADRERARTDFLTKGAHEMSASEFESWRIARELPFSENEINAQFQPLQLGLFDVIHWAKGCYIGQEVVSRLESKDRAQKTLLGLKVPESVWKTLKKGDIFATEQGDALITSVAPLYLDNEANALAVMKVKKSALTA